MEWLIKKGVPFIFYPCIPYERNEVAGAGTTTTAPIVTSYAENIKNNMEGLEENHIQFMNPFMAFTDEKTLTKQLVQEFKHEFQISSMRSGLRPIRPGKSFPGPALMWRKRVRRCFPI